MGAPAYIEEGPSPLHPGADPKLAKGLAGGWPDPGRKGGAQPPGGAASRQLDWNWDLPLGGDTRSCLRRRGRERRRKKEKKKREEEEEGKIETGRPSGQ